MPRPLLAPASLTLAAAPATADYIAPDSILRPPPATHAGVSEALVTEADYVTDPYAGLGLIYPVRVLTSNVTYAAAVAIVGGVNVWTALLRYGSGAGAVSALTMDVVG